MAYRKPGVLITQVQESVSPALVEPDLYTAIVGRPYYVFKPGDVNLVGTTATYWDPSANPTLTINLDTQWRTQNPSISGVVSQKSIYVDAVAISGSLAGQRVHMEVNNTTPTDNTQQAYFSGNNLIISSGTVSTFAGSAFRIEAGFSVLRHDLQKVAIFEGGSDIQAAIGPTTVFNELGTAITIAASNSNRVTYAYGIIGNTTTDHDLAQDALTSKEVYAIAPMDDNYNSIIQDYKEYVESQSKPENKKERIVIASATIPWSENNYGSTDSTVKLSTSNAISARSAIAQARRMILIHPDVAYIREKLRIWQIKQDYLKNNLGVSNFIGNYGLYALFTDTVTLSDGTRFYKDDNITDTVWSSLEADGINELTVLVPVPGYFLAAAVAGQVSGEDPEQPLTNLPIGGLARIKYSNDHFSDSNLDSMAEGGTYIMEQDTPLLPVTCRHQLTTDTTSIETRELSIQKSIDFTAKFLRRNLRSVIGRHNITDQFLKQLRLVINAAGITLVRKGVLKDLKLVELKQNTTAPDRVTGKVRALPLYPSNYIEIDLIY